jgi:catechol-2,3-dioxygenase
VVGIPVSGVNELVLEVLDLERAEAFYAGVLGFPIAGRRENDRIWLMAGTRTRIGLWRPQVGIADGRGGVHVHYAMQIAEKDYAPAVARLREHGYDPHEEDFGDSGRAAYVTDPDGNVVELWTWEAGLFE